MIESVQRRATKPIKGMEGMSREEKLRMLGLPSVDLIALYNFVKEKNGAGGAGLLSVMTDDNDVQKQNKDIPGEVQDGN